MVTRKYEKPIKKLSDRCAFDSGFKGNSKTLRALLEYIRSIDPIWDSKSFGVPSKQPTPVASQNLNQPPQTQTQTETQNSNQQQNSQLSTLSKIYNEPVSTINDYPFLIEACKKIDSTLDSNVSMAMSSETDGSMGGGDPQQQQESVNLQSRIEAFSEWFVEISAWIDEIPLESRSGMRFGNKTFRLWQERLAERTPSFMKKLLKEEIFSNAFEEISEYFCASFGDQTRIDYGTGHECSFLCVLYCLEVGYGYFKREERNVYATVLFSNYMCIMRKLQAVYVLEPAGSHGVWGLDDFHLVIFYFGARQMLAYSKTRSKIIDGIEIPPSTGPSGSDGAGSAPEGSIPLPPNSIPAFAEYQRTVEQCRFEFFPGAVRNNLDTKKGAPFHETSPQLHSVLESVPSWEKISTALVKMYSGEVLDKFPVIQHFLFGTTLPFE